MFTSDMAPSTPVQQERFNRTLRHLRVFQVRGTARLVRALSRSRLGLGAVQACASSPGLSALYRAVMGFNQPFPTLEAATAACALYTGGGHTSADYFKLTWETTERVRLSDYPVLFHLQCLLPLVRQVFDMGGHLGNMYYCYSRVLSLPMDLAWTVCDLPEVIEAGREMAVRQGETRLRFTSEFKAADACDLVLASGSTHYFAQPFSDLIRSLPNLPSFVIINRSPMLNDATVATVQDGGTYRVACVLHNRSQLISDFATMGYRLVDQWSAPEHYLEIAGYPQFSASAYSGLFFARGTTRI